jgi:hypothetical protein
LTVQGRSRGVTSGARCLVAPAADVAAARRSGHYGRLAEPCGGNVLSADPVPNPSQRRVPAPLLRETADIWFDTGRDPVITWDGEGRRFELVDPVTDGERLTLYVAPGPVADPRRLALALADGLAACDFPPTGDGASPSHVAKALRVAGIDPDAP